MSKTIYSWGSGSMTTTEFLARIDQFATLATRLDFQSVAELSLGSHACHASHADKINESEGYPNNPAFTERKICFCWLSIALEEGHLEPSQPSVGRIIGWPQKMINKKSLWIDFLLWFYKLQLSQNGLPEQWVFYELLDRVFVSKADKYEVPNLGHCREIFISLRPQYERN